MSERVILRVGEYCSPDVDLKSWTPATSSDVMFLLEMEIGLAGEEGSDVWQVVVATPEGLRDKVSGLVLSDRATMIISHYSWADVRARVEAIVRQCESATLSESVLKLQRFFAWEYEDYVAAEEESL